MHAVGSNRFRKSLKSPRGKMHLTYLKKKKKKKVRLCLGHVVVTFFWIQYEVARLVISSNHDLMRDEIKAGEQHQA